ncbi:MAG: ribosome small subunit-dependent GTPase A [Lachnospiraceae bacterium]|nr:ribosome small subunit-dependent GTPase A [Lachnospiraceae bacterium]
MRGKIIRGVGGFYYVHAEDSGVYECRARGIFRKEKIKPLVGDDVEISVLDEKERTGNVDRLLPRRNMLIRPAAANVDQAMVVFALNHPQPNLNLLDRFLIMMNRQQIPVIICFNKMDLADAEQIQMLEQIYRGCGCEVCFISVAQQEGLDHVRRLLEGKTTVLAGPSGVGKSSLTNSFLSEQHMEVGEISRKADRGKHTTRHTELLVLNPCDSSDPQPEFSVDQPEALNDSPELQPEFALERPDADIRRNSYILDTPGFTSLYLPDIEYEELKEYFHEFAPYEEQCRFQGCMHLKEPDCAVKAAVEVGEIPAARYESYTLLAEELKNRKKY